MQRTSVRDSAPVRLRDDGKAPLNAVRHYFDRRHLEASLASLVDAAVGHEAQGLAPGAPLYLVLNCESELLVSDYCERWQVGIERLNAEIPALGRLRKLAYPSARKTPAAVLILVAGMLLAFLAGIAAGLVRLGYHLVGGGR